MAEDGSQPAVRLAPPTLAALVFTFGLGVTLISPPAPILLWNASPSSPVGLYLLSPGSSPGLGQTAIAWPPPAARRLAAARSYLPPDVLLVKLVLAGSGSRICAKRQAIFVDGELAAFRRARDGAGRPMPWWPGCQQLGTGDLFLLSPGDNSFDGRYFGVTRSGEVIGRARLLWGR